ncbi:hypothetical protein [Aestuariimicrobium ganziense]|uniref:hypothetical protein n=1 Tax=Aestuariimicrobium ganziense TaxID=2773677 RepID=UPI0038B2D83F
MEGGHVDDETRRSQLEYARGEIDEDRSRLNACLPAAVLEVAAVNGNITSSTGITAARNSMNTTWARPAISTMIDVVTEAPSIPCGGTIVNSSAGGIFVRSADHCIIQAENLSDQPMNSCTTVAARPATTRVENIIMTASRPGLER